MIFRCLPLTIAVAALIAFFAPPARALMPEVPLSELSLKSPTAVRATALSATSYWDDEEQRIRTRVELRAHYPIIGQPATSLTVDMAGGYLEEQDFGEHTTSSPNLEVGREYLLFLLPHEDRWQVAAGPRGAFEIIDGHAFRYGADSGMPLDELYAEIENALTDPARSFTLPSDWKELERIAAANAPATAPRWDADPEQYWRNIPVTFYVNTNSRSAPTNMTHEELLQQIILGAEIWNQVPSSNFQFVYAGPSDATNSLDANNRQNDVYFEAFTGGVFGAPYAEATTRWSSQQGFTEADIRFNDNYLFTILREPFQNGLDVRSIAAHEFGHCLGLGHDGVLMQTYYENGEVRRQPGIDDEGGANFLYPIDPPVGTDPPPNELIENAIPIIPGVELQGSVRNATVTTMSGVGSFACTSLVHADVWYRYDPQVSGDLSVAMCGSGVITRVEIFESMPGGDLTEINCGERGCKWKGTIHVPHFATPVEAGKTYYIRVAASNINLGLFLIHLEQFTRADNVADYLVGRENDPTGLEFNNDSIIDAGDAVLTQ